MYTTKLTALTKSKNKKDYVQKFIFVVQNKQTFYHEATDLLSYLRTLECIH